MLGDLVRHGFNVTDDHEEADAVIINTCAFVEDAKTESVEVSCMVCRGDNGLGRAHHESQVAPEAFGFQKSVTDRAQSSYA